MGSTHVRVGVLYYIILTIVILPVISTLPLLYGIHKYGFSLFGLLVAALAAAMPDLDSQHSLINQLNPVTGVTNRIVDIVVNITGFVVKLVFTLGIAVLLFLYASQIINQLNQIQYIKPYSHVITYGAAAVLIVSGIMGESGIVSLPIIGGGYKILLSGIRKAGNFVKRSILVIVYAGSGFLIIIYNIKHSSDSILYIIGALLIAIAIFPHRSFLHSLEGLILFSYCAFYFSKRVGIPYIGNAFFIGYSSHLYLSDMFTKEGIPLSIIPGILKKIGLYERIDKVKFIRFVLQVLSIRLKIPISSTGTAAGKRIEALYVLILLIIASTIMVKYGITLNKIKVI